MLSLNDFAFLHQTPKERRRWQNIEAGQKRDRSRYFPPKQAYRKGFRICLALPVMPDDLPG